MTTQSARRTKQKVMIIASGLLFLASTGLTIVNLFSTAMNQPKDETTQRLINPIEQREESN